MCLNQGPSDNHSLSHDVFPPEFTCLRFLVIHVLASLFLLQRDCPQSSSPSTTNPLGHLPALFSWQHLSMPSLLSCLFVGSLHVCTQSIYSLRIRINNHNRFNLKFYKSVWSMAGIILLFPPLLVGWVSWEAGPMKDSLLFGFLNPSFYRQRFNGLKGYNSSIGTIKKLHQWSLVRKQNQEKKRHHSSLGTLNLVMSQHTLPGSPRNIISKSCIIEGHL